MKEAQSDPRTTHPLLPHLAGRPSHLVAAAGAAPVFPNRRAAAGAARAYPSRMIVAVAAAGAARVCPNRKVAAGAYPIPRPAAVAQEHPSHPAVAERQPVFPRRAAVALVDDPARAYPIPRPAAVAQVNPRRVVGAVAARAFPTRQLAVVAQRLHPNHPAAPSPVGPVDRHLAASASHCHREG